MIAMQWNNPVTAIICPVRAHFHRQTSHRLFQFIVIVAAAFCAIAWCASGFAQSGDMVLPADSDTPPPSSGAIQIKPAIGGIEVKADDLTAAISLAHATATPGGKVTIKVHFSVAPGWHIYGAPLPPGEDLTPTSIEFSDQLAAHQSIVMPKPLPLRFEALGETLPVYQGDFSASGELQLKPDLKPGPQALGGTLRFQECNDSMCKMPRTVHFNLPLQITG
jgi:DsbC/DsbD-like thiol-disulfide interchange protein